MTVKPGEGGGNMQHAYTSDPLANLTREQATLVMGGQQLLWTEQNGPESLDSTPNGSALDVNTALTRLHKVRYRLFREGHWREAVQPEWCASRPFLCNGQALERVAPLLESEDEVTWIS
ncbi:hypothetical protein EV122DRAFT_285377 [Schizophyllum commune]